MKMFRVSRVGATPLRGLGVMCCLQALMLPGDYAQAATIVDNATLDINSSLPATDYLVRNNGVLNASGANTRSITAQTGSTLNISGTTVVGNAGIEGVVVTSSKGTIDQTSITSDDVGLAVNRSSVAAGGSSVTVSNSRITGDVAGAQVTGLSTLSLINSQVTGAGVNGIGVNILGGEVNASAGTHITGQSTGVRIVNDSANVGARTLSLDNATVQGVDGSAILVERGTQAIIHILNGSTLLAGNNILLDIQGASAATVAVAGSSLTGNINVAAGSNGDISFEQSQMTGDVLVNGTSTTTLNLAGNSNLSGNMRITDGSTGHLNFEQSTMTGDVLVEASTATVNLGYGSALEGNVNVTGNSLADLALDQSQMKGDVIVNGASSANLSVTANSALTGKIDITGGSTGHLNFNQGHMAGDVRVNDSTATIAFANGSSLEGDVNFTGNSRAGLTFDQSQMKGNVLIDSLPDTTTLNFANGSSLDGNVNIDGGSNVDLSVDKSRMIGDVIAKGASTADLSVTANSALTGKIDITGGSTGHLNFNQGHMAGDVRVNDSTATVAFANSSSLEGDVNFTGNSRAGLTFDQSQMKGNVLIDSLPDTTTLNFANGSSLDGNVNIDGGSNVDLSVDQSRMIGDVIAKGASTADLNVTANSLLTGAVNLAEGSTGKLNFNQGHMVGNVLVNDSTATVAFANNSSLEGDVNFTGNSRADLTFDNSQMKGNVLIDSLPETTTLKFANGSSLDGGVNIAGGSNVDLNFGQSQLSGDVRVAGNSTAQMALNDSTFLGNLNISDGSTANLTLNRSQMTGDVVADGSTINESVTLENQSQLTGRLDKVKSVNIKSQSNWTLTGNDNIGTLGMNGGSVTFGAAEATSTYYTLNVGTLAGTTGTFVMKGDFVSGESDKLIVAGQSTGNYELAVAASGLDAVAPEQVVLVRTGTTDGASFTLAGDRAVDLGTWSYSLVSRTNAEDGKEWYLDPKTEVISPGAQSILALFNSPLTIVYGEQSSLRTRMGELRLNGGESGGWVRTYGSQYNVADGSGVGYQLNQRGFSLGADARLGDSGWLLGVLAGTSKSDLNLDHGTTGTVNSYYVGPYATWLDADTGYYFDGVLKFNRFRNESKVNLSDGTRSKGDYDNWGLGASAEFGRQFKLADGYFFEPFTQWSAVQIQGKRYTLNNDMTADGDTTRSLLGKAGVTVGRNFEFGEASIAQPYLRMAVAHEFAKNNEVKVNDNVFNNDLSGTRAEFGAGVAVAMSEKWQVHADFDYSKGEHIEKPWGINFGLMYRW